LLGLPQPSISNGLDRGEGPPSSNPRSVREFSCSYRKAGSLPWRSTYANVTFPSIPQSSVSFSRVVVFDDKDQLSMGFFHRSTMLGRYVTDDDAVCRIICVELLYIRGGSVCWRWNTRPNGWVRCYRMPRPDGNRRFDIYSCVEG